MSYSITREDPERDLKALRYLIEVGMVRDSPTGDVLRELHDLIEEQVKPQVEEPTGDVVVNRGGWFYKPGGVKGWVRDDLYPVEWEYIAGDDPGDLAVYRNETELAKRDESVAYSNGYAKGAEDTRNQAIANGNTWRAGWAKGAESTRDRIHTIVADLKPQLITSASERCAIDKALAAIKADVENTAGGPRYQS